MIGKLFIFGDILSTQNTKFTDLVHENKEIYVCQFDDTIEVDCPLENKYLMRSSF